MIYINNLLLNQSRQRRHALFNWLLVLLLILPTLSYAEHINVAVASNFSRAAKHIAASFEKQTGHSVSLSFGSTGKQHAQIMNGAPFDIFLAADVARPLALEEEGLVKDRFTYALGQLVLWGAEFPSAIRDLSVLDNDGVSHIAIANPRFAPYGRAAQQVLESDHRWDRLQSTLVRGENISQAYQFVASGNAQLGFVALSQVKHRIEPTLYWAVPAESYEPIEQQAVLLNDRAITKQFSEFMQSTAIRSFIQESGYEVP